MEKIGERISFTLDPRNLLLFLQIGFSFISTAVVYAILERTIDFESACKTIHRGIGRL